MTVWDPWRDGELLLTLQSEKWLFSIGGGAGFAADVGVSSPPSFEARLSIRNRGATVVVRRDRVYS